ncbi:MAG: amino acid adenylation domain-containing protein [Acidobacteria bacterium]|nr:amino acid adenylation domain-containing protein [Acidobacteriota bacterium]
MTPHPFACVVVGDAGVTVRCLDILRSRGHLVRGIVTEDGRVAAWGAERGVPVLLHRERAPLFAAAVRALAGDGEIDFLFSIHNLRIFSPELLALPRAIAINFHDAPLPRYGGLHATTWAIARGETRHGITWHRMTDAIDEGDILLQRELPILPDDTAWSLGSRCVEVACEAFEDLIDGLATSTAKPQPAHGRSYFTAWETPTPGCILPVDASAETIERHVRALQFGPAHHPLGFPTLLTPHGPVVIESASALASVEDEAAPPGRVLRVDGRALRMRTATGDVHLTLEREVGLCAGDVLSMPDAQSLERIAQLTRETSRHERWWSDRLLRQRALAPASFLQEPQAEPIEVTVALPATSLDEAILALANVLAAELGEAFDLGLSEETLRARIAGAPAMLFADVLPLRVPGPHTLLDVPAIVAARADLARHGTHRRDLPRRNRRLRATESLPMRLTIGAELPADQASALDALLASDGRLLTLRSRTTTAETLDSLAQKVGRAFGASLLPSISGRSVLTILEEQMKRTPRGCAIEAAGRAITYEELNARSARLAAALRRRGAGDESLIALRSDDLVDLVTGMLAILRAGAAFLVIDARDPAARNALVLADARPLLGLGGRELQALAPDLAVHPLTIADANESPEEVLPPIDDRSLAYVAYTSGSGGAPKGVAIEHRALAHFVLAAGRLYRFAPGDRILQFGTAAFDLAYEQIFGSLVHGATLVASRDRYEGPRELLQDCVRDRISVLDLPTAVFAQLANAVAADALELPPELRLTIVGGEALRRADAVRWLSAGKRQPHPSALVNTYGPTEATIIATAWTVPREADDLPEVIPIGTPLDGMRVAIIGEDGIEAAEGELLLAGPQLARGYHRHPERTAERFVALDGIRFYRTGDRVRRAANGELLFLGRVDRQLKIGSRRVEPEEIETVLLAGNGVADAVVLPAPADDGLVALRAWVVPQPRAKIDVDELRAQLVQALPAAMRPSRIDVCAKLPRSANGKLDAAAVAELIALDGAPLAPSTARSATEEVLASIWNRLLGCVDIGPSDDFFSHGGDSLTSVRLLEAIERELGARLPLQLLLQDATLAGLAARIDARDRPRRSFIIPMQPQGTRPPIFCVHGLGGHVIRLRSLAAAFAPDQPFYGIQSPGLDDDLPISRTVEEMASRYLDAIDEIVPPAAPIRLCGKSFGGIVALEMARKARARGRVVEFLGLLDTYLDRLLPAAAPKRRPYARILDSVQTVRKSLRGRLTRLVRRWTGGPADARAPNEYRNFLSVTRANRAALARYRLGIYEGDVTFFAAEVRSARIFAALRARTHCRLRVIEVGGDHLSMVEPAHLPELIAAWKRAMNEPAL